MDNLKFEKINSKEMSCLKGGQWYLINGVLVWIEGVPEDSHQD